MMGITIQTSKLRRKSSQPDCHLSDMWYVRMPPSPGDKRLGVFLIQGRRVAAARLPRTGHDNLWLDGEEVCDDGTRVSLPVYSRGM